MKKIRSRVAENIPHCSSCILRNICGAPCPGEVFSEKGTVLEKSPYCEFYEALICYAFQLIGRGELKNLIKEKKYEFRYSTFA